MKIKLILGFASLLAVAAIHADAPSAITRTNTVANATNQFRIAGMDCAHCAKGIASELRRTRGVADAEVSFTNRLAVVAYDTNAVSPKKLVLVIQEAGYTAQPVKR
jgi:copper chaperone